MSTGNPAVRRRGSPPRAWGQLVRSLIASGRLRFTPTGVGTTCSAIPATGTNAVHPHGRGDNRAVIADESPDSGSPPRAWGQRRIGRWRFVGNRFTPTGVGTTDPSGGADNHDSVHPHGRGDNASMWAGLSTDDGSPPRAWGQR